MFFVVVVVVVVVVCSRPSFPALQLFSDAPDGYGFFFLFLFLFFFTEFYRFTRCSHDYLRLVFVDSGLNRIEFERIQLSESWSNPVKPNKTPIKTPIILNNTQ